MKPEFVFIYDENRRIYKKGACGTAIYREHWRKHEIVGETSRSWVTKWGNKVPKRNYLHRLYCFSEQELDERCYVHENRYRISDLVRREWNYERLRKIAELIGYKEPSHD